jgi:hypothetical protein
MVFLFQIAKQTNKFFRINRNLAKLQSFFLSHYISTQGAFRGPRTNSHQTPSLLLCLSLCVSLSISTLVTHFLFYCKLHNLNITWLYTWKPCLNENMQIWHSLEQQLWGGPSQGTTQQKDKLLALTRCMTAELCWYPSPSSAPLTLHGPSKCALLSTCTTINHNQHI